MPEDCPSRLHANCLILGNKGILLTGPSSSGKSALTLALIERAHWSGKTAFLVSDDYTDLSNQNGKLCARSPKTLAGGIEIRGAGLYQMTFKNEVIVDFAVALGSGGKRYPAENKITYCGIKIPLYNLPDLNTADGIAISQAIEALVFKTPWKKPV